MIIKLKIEEAAKSRGIETQGQLIVAIKEKTGEDIRPATVSDLYRNTKESVNKKHLLLVMRGLEISDFNELLTIEE